MDYKDPTFVSLDDAFAYKGGADLTGIFFCLFEGDDWIVDRNIIS